MQYFINKFIITLINKKFNNIIFQIARIFKKGAKLVKFLHTADWHLGAKTNGRDRLGEQKKVLDEIVSIVNYENIDCIIVAGDVFNTSSPSAEAEELFFESIQKLSDGGDRFVFVLAGNHDDPTRLSAGLPLSSKHNIALVSSLDRLKEGSFNKNAIVQVIETARGHIKIKKNEEVVTIAYLPYPNEVRIKDKVDPDFSYAQKVQAWADMGASAFNEDTFNIFVSHLFMVGSKTKDSVVKVGDIMAVPKNMLPKADYTALGHLHTPQDLGDGVHYSGAITNLTVGQKNLGVTVFETENGEIISKEHIPLKNIARYEKVTASSIEDAEEKLVDFDDGDIVELEIVQSEPLSASRLKALRKNFTCISNVSLIKVADAGSVVPTKKRKLLSDEELFKQFYKSVRGFEASEDIIKMYNDCKGDSNETN